MQLHENVDFLPISAVNSCILSQHTEKAWFEPCRLNICDRINNGVFLIKDVHVLGEWVFLPQA